MITNEERDLVFSIADGDTRIIHCIGHIRIICEDTKDNSYLPVLRWLKKEKITGKDFINWLSKVHNDSILNAISYARMMAFKDHKKKKLFAKKLSK